MAGTLVWNRPEPYSGQRSGDRSQYCARVPARAPVGARGRWSSTGGAVCRSDRRDLDIRLTNKKHAMSGVWSRRCAGRTLPRGALTSMATLPPSPATTLRCTLEFDRAPPPHHPALIPAELLSGNQIGTCCPGTGDSSRPLGKAATSTDFSLVGDPSGPEADAFEQVLSRLESTSASGRRAP